MINIGKAKKKKTKACGDKKDGKAASFEAMGTLFKMNPQKFRVANMQRPFPLDKDGNIKAMSGEEIIKHCQGYIGCGMIMHMRFALDPDKTSYRDKKEKKK